MIAFEDIKVGRERGQMATEENGPQAVFKQRGTVIRNTKELGPEAALADRIWELRYERGWSGSEMGRRAGIGRATVTNLERGKGTPRLWTLRKLARAFDITLDELLAGVPDPDGDSETDTDADTDTEPEEVRAEGATRLL